MLWASLYKRNPSINRVAAYTMLSTVAQQKKMFSRREIQSTNAARKLYPKIGRPNEASFYHILMHSLIRNCPVTPDDAKCALIIYGPDIAVVKGKTTRSAAAPRAPTFVAEPVQAPILEHNRDATLCVDFFFVQGLPFLHTNSRNIGFHTAHQALDRAESTILRPLRRVIHRHQTRGLIICNIHRDNEALLPTALNIVPADSHVGEVERSTRTIKERLRSCTHDGLLFKCLPKLL